MKSLPQWEHNKELYNNGKKINYIKTTFMPFYAYKLSCNRNHFKLKGGLRVAQKGQNCLSSQWVHLCNKITAIKTKHLRNLRENEK